MWIYVWVQSSGRPSPNSQIRTSSNIALLNVPLQPKALSAPVTTCAPAKPCTICSCSNIFVIDGQQVQLSMPMAAVWGLRQLRHPLSPQAGVKIADRVYFGGSPTRESSVELFDHIYHNITPVFPFVGINKDNIPWLLLLTYFQKSNQDSLVYTSPNISQHQGQSWVSQVQPLTEISDFMYLSFQDKKP